MDALFCQRIEIGRAQRRHRTHEEGAHERGALAEDIVDAEVLARLFAGDDLGKIRARHRLDGALEQAHAHGEDPELVFPVQKDGVYGDEEVGDDTGDDQVLRLDPAREHPQQDGGGEGDHLGDEESDDQADRIQPQRGAVGGGEVDDGIHAVDKEEEGEQEQPDALIAGDLFEGVPERAQSNAHGMACGFHELPLLVAAPQGQRAGDPPHRHDEEDDDHAHLQRDEFKHIIHHIHGDGEYEGDTAADIPPGIAAGRDFVHALAGGDVAQHGIVHHQAELVGRFGEHEQHEEPYPVLHKAERHAPQRPDEHGDGEDLPPHAAQV